MLKKQLSIATSQLEEARTEIQELRVWSCHVAPHFQKIAQRCEAAEQNVLQLQRELTQQTRNYIKLQEEGESMKLCIVDRTQWNPYARVYKKL